MGWTWKEYQEQPAQFVDTVVELLKAESKQWQKQTQSYKS